jgi:dipeptide/tripeptide permease
MFTQKNRFTLILLSVAVLLLIPFIAMQFTTEVNWTFSDFLAMGFLLLGAGLICELVLRTVKKNRNRVILCLLVLALFFLVWAELAVGIFGTPLAGS